MLVTGGAGFIGSHVVPCLLRRGHRVRVVDDFSTGRREHLPSDVDLIEATVTDESIWAAALRGIDRVVHLAAIASVERSVREPAATNAVNLGATIALAHAMARHGVQRIVYASSAAIYGDAARDRHRETDHGAPLSPYAIDKLAGEEYLRFFATSHGLDARALRFFNVYGPRQDPASPYSGVIARFTDDLLVGRELSIYGDGEQTRDFVFVDDVAHVVARHVEDDGEAPGALVMNVCTGERTTLHGVIAALEAAVGSMPRLRYAPEREGDVRSSLGSCEALDAWYPERPRTRLVVGLEQVVSWRRATLTTLV